MTAKKIVDEKAYPERPFSKAKADPAALVKIEDRQPDQIADYHKKFPTLKAASGGEDRKGLDNNQPQG